jgi:alkaline phosphatase D
MARISRRSFIESAVAIGATAAWRFASPKTTKIRWREERVFFPEGVASGDPDSSSVLLWTRHTPGAQQVTAEVAEAPCAFPDPWNVAR